MKSTWVVAVLLFVVVVSGAQAQFLTSGLSPRALGMGSVGVAVADDGIAWVQNPAGLGSLACKCPAGKTWANDVIGAYANADNSSWGLSWSGWEPCKKLGAGAGYFDFPNSKVFGAGFGISLKDSPLSFGINAVHFDPDSSCDDSQTTIGLGALYQFAKCPTPLRVGLLAEDVTNQTDLGPIWDGGVAWQAMPQLLVAADVLDITNETDAGPFYNIGAEYGYGKCMEWKFRAGLVDTGDGHDVSLGAGYNFGNNWRADAAWVNSDSSLWSLGAGYTF